MSTASPRHNFPLRLLLLLLLMAGGVQRLAAQELSARVTSPAKDYVIGSTIPIELTVTCPPGYHVQWKKKLPIVGNVEEADSMQLDSVKKDKRIVYHQRSTIQAFDSGTFYISPIPFYFQKQGDTSRFTISSDTLKIHISLISVDLKKDIKPIRGPIQLPEEKPFAWWQWLLLALIGIAVGVFIILVWRRNKDRRRVTTSPQDMRSAYEKAMEALSHLGSRATYTADEEVKAYFVELSDILRRYLHGGLGIPAPERTTAQTLRIAQRKALPLEQVQQLRSLLERADLVKFARLHPDADTCRAELDDTEKVIRELHNVYYHSPQAVNS